MNQTKLTVSIGIAAYNEEHSLPRLLQSIFRQNKRNYTLDSIIVISDGSTDKTVEIVQELKLNNVVLKIHKNRKGKTSRVNELLTMSKSDILVLFDADILIKDRNLIEKMVNVFMKEPHVLGISGSIMPIEPKNFIQKIIHTGVDIWDKVRLSRKNTEVYFCTGAVRAFHKKLYKELFFPSISAEDVYPYLYCLSKHYSFKIVPEAQVYYGLPATYSDYFNQMKRYLQSKTVHTHHFNDEIINKAYVITTKNRVSVLLKEIIFNPFWTIAYLLFLIPVRVQLFTSNKKDEGVWNTISSSKNI